MTEMREVLEKLELVMRRCADKFVPASGFTTGHHELFIMLADEINKVIRDLPEPPPCIYESVEFGPGGGRAWCRTHGFDCPHMRPTDANPR